MQQGNPQSASESGLLRAEAPPPTPHAQRITYLDGWRGLAVALVIVGHFTESCWWMAGLGVQLFFALSGRLMADILFVERFPLRAFYLRRFSRIYPGVVVFVLGAFLLVQQTPMSFKPLAAASALTFTLNYPLALGHGVAAIENLWSLCIEEHSYVLLGLTALLVRARPGSKPALILLAVAAASLLDMFVSALVFHHEGRAILWRTDTQLAPIFLAAAAYLQLRRWRMPPWLPVAAFAGGLASALGPELLQWSLGTLLFSIATAALDDAPAWLRKVLSGPILVRLGLWSYSLYLWQQPFARFVRDDMLSRPAALAATFAISLLSFYLVEQPARRRLNGSFRAKGRLRAPAREAEPA